MSNETEPLVRFQEAVRIARTLIDNGSIFVFVSPIEVTDIKVQVDRESLEVTLRPTPFSYDDFNNFLGEISRLIAISLEKNEDAYIESRVEYWRDEEKYDEARIANEKSMLQSKLRSVNETLVDNRLRQRYILKQCAKSPYFTGFDWEINVKHSDGETEIVQPLPYATCQIRFAEPGTKYRFSFLEHTESVQIDWTEEELDYMIRVFEVIKQRIQHLKGTVK